MDAEVWVLLPPRPDSIRVGPIRAALVRECDARGWGLQVRPTYQLADKPFLSPQDTDTLYRRLHRARVVVVSIQAPESPGPHFFKRPPPASARTYSPENIGSIRTLCRHKGLFYRWRWNRGPAGWGSIFASWCERVQCEGPEDPRCLPLHVFRCETHWSKEIARTDGRVNFDAHHGTGHERTDAVGLRWRRGPLHGRDILHISGHPLPAGFHWDVQGSGCDIWTPVEGWVVRRYLNVAPDGRVRGREPYAKLIPLRP